MNQLTLQEPQIYQGQFGEFTITQEDRRSVIIYRSGLGIAGLCFALGTGIVVGRGYQSGSLEAVTLPYAVFCLALGVSLWTIHIYLAPLHRALQVFWGLGCLAALAIAVQTSQPLVLTVYEQPLTLFGLGWIFVSLTGIFFKEAFCFDRLETKLLTVLVPGLLLGHLTGMLPLSWEKGLLVSWAVLFGVFVLRKAVQPIPPDIGDKTVFAYLSDRRAANA